jgi:Ser/Thr protein kinase RdoA (MazF antagonist)
VIEPVTAVLSRPTMTAHHAARVLADRWVIRGTLQPLPSERDRNFRVSDEQGPRWVFKVSNLAEDRALLELQHQAMLRLAEAGVPCPQPVSAEGRTVVGLGHGDGPPLARVLTWLPGRPLADLPASERGLTLLRHLGLVMGRTAGALAGLSPAAARRDFQWDPLRGPAVIAAHSAAVARSRRVLLDAATERLGLTLWPRLAGIRRSLIHNDANDHNVLVDAEARSVIGLLDFGDMVESVTVNEAAVAAAYALLDVEQPLEAVAAVGEGFHHVLPLTPAEIRVLFELVIARLVTSVALSAHQASLDPGDPYLTISEAPAWRAIEALLRIDPDYAAGRIGVACR